MSDITDVYLKIQQTRFGLEVLFCMKKTFYKRDSLILGHDDVVYQDSKFRYRPDKLIIFFISTYQLNKLNAIFNLLYSFIVIKINLVIKNSIQLNGIAINLLTFTVLYSVIAQDHQNTWNPSWKQRTFNNIE